MRHADAMRVVETIRAELEQSGGAAAVAVVDAHGELVAFLRTDGCPLPSIANAMHKAYTAARERITSEELGRRSRQEGFPMTNYGDLRYTSWGGGVPIVSGGEVVGAVGVSGLPEADDIALATMGARLVD
jgi:glc operon protein GlcG